MYNLGQMYLQGSLYTPRDQHRGVQLIAAAADLGLAEVKYYWLHIFLEGIQINLYSFDK